ncbi:hypothetical protein NLG97_g354 [Lecanicillium saksenae]|uniref:Uncharacterized protein n=1 Tax=Lecanicillium saksenae TaxID=468837 RepID=A0ACC1R8Q6_9HYPO|nr:hypothetical protein NLG97_g354 [Lecanicillium saksenae]
MGSKNPPPDERVVYLALKNIFKGQNAQVRKNKTVAKLIKQYKTQESVANLLREYNFDVVCGLASNLLSAEIFDSTLKAKVRFPELFDSSSTQSAEKEASEAEAARYEAEAIRHALQLGSQVFQPVSRQQGGDEGSRREVDVVAEIDEETKQAPRSCPPVVQVPSIFPVYLPIATHLSTYGRKLPDVMRNRGWDCPEAVELNLWAGEFSKRLPSFDKSPNVGVPLRELFQSIANIRHTAVHRVGVHAKRIENFLSDGERLMVLLEHAEHREKISKLRRDAGTALGELGRNKHLLRTRLDDTLQNISQQRKKLDLWTIIISMRVT